MDILENTFLVFLSVSLMIIVFLILLFLILVALSVFAPEGMEAVRARFNMWLIRKFGGDK